MKKIKIDVTCPQCEKKFKERVENMRPGKTTKCPYCSTTINYSGEDLSKVQTVLDDFGKKINNKLGN